MACGGTTKSPGLRRLAHCSKAVFAVACLIAALTAPSFGAPSAPAPVKTTLSVTTNDGYARLVFTASEYIDGSARLAGNVLIVSFKQPLDVAVNRVPEQASDYIGAARRDPDGKAVRMALEQAVTIHAMSAGEKFFVDLLPASWKGMPPGLPQDVVDELARRAREAERLLERQRNTVQAQKAAPIRVHVASQPTFTRYVFAVPSETGVSADRAKDRLVLKFDSPLTFDLGDAQGALPKTVQEISSELDQNSSLVRFMLAANTDTRTFRDESGYVVDVVNPPADADAADGGAPETVPAGEAAKPGGEGVPSLADAAAKISAAAAAPGPPPAPMPMTAPAAPPRPAAMPPTAQMMAPPKAAVAPAPPQPAAPSVAPAQQPAAAPPASAPLESHPAVHGALPPSSDVAKNAAQNAAQNNPPAVAAAMAPAPVPQQAAIPAPAPKLAETAPPPNLEAAPPPKLVEAAPAPAKPVAPQIAPAPPVKTSDAAAPAAAPMPPAKKSDTAPPATKNDAAPLPAAATRKDDSAGKIAAELNPQGADLKLTFAFKAPTGMAVFSRADTLWLVFDSKAEMDLSALDGEPSRTIRSYDFSHSGAADVVRLKLDRPRLSSVAADGDVWTINIGDTIIDPTRSLDVSRNLIGSNRASVSISYPGAQHVYRIADPDVGDSLFVVTAMAPARGLIDEQDFIEFHALPSTQGVVIEPLADDLNVTLDPDKVVVTRPLGLTLSTTIQTLMHGSGVRSAMFDSQVWGSDRQGAYFAHQEQLIDVAAAAPPHQRLVPRLELARFYIARGMYPEAKGVLDVALDDERKSAESVSALVLRAVCDVMMNRPEDALKDLSDPSIGDQHDAPLWRALAYAKQGRWAKARDTFKTMAAAMATLPVELQRVALKDDMRSAIEVGDFNAASDDLNDFQTIGIPHQMEPALAVLMGRLAEGLGRKQDALAAYRTAADSWDRPAAAQGLLRETVLRYQLGDMTREAVINQLESLTTIWRGDETEVEALKVLAHLYTEEGRYRDAFYVMRSAMAARPDSALTHQIQDEAAATFDALFLTNKGDAMPPIDALALFYDFRELTPIGARGDEMIRRLADRLVSVDLLDQAADLLQYQVDHRLQGAARAQVATRLAVIYLMDRKPDRALAALRSTRAGGLSNDLRDQRLLLEARALSDLGRHELALEVIADVQGRPAERLRADILWAGKRYDEAAEQIELMYGDRYKDFAPLNDEERADIMRAEIGYALSSDQLGLGRFRDKYAAKMASTPDARNFQIVSAPLGASGDEFASVARAAASVDTLETFLHEMKVRYPDSSAVAPPTEPPPPPPPPAPPSASASPPETRPAAPNGPDLGPLPPARASGRTAMR
jgi:tetratricopeptide (TPR) repeat protein